MDRPTSHEKCPEDRAVRVKPALEKVLMNSPSYGKPDGATTAEIEVHLHWNQQKGVAEIHHNGLRIDPPEKAPVPDTAVAKAILPDHRLGLMLARHFMDSMQYRSEKQRNHLRMTVTAHAAAGN